MFILPERKEQIDFAEPYWGSATLIFVTKDNNTIKTIREQGVTVLLVEQNALAALEVADYGYVLESGSLSIEGSAAQLLSDDSVARAYLGG